jgi:hypothetical protein
MQVAMSYQQITYKNKNKVYCDICRLYLLTSSHHMFFLLRKILSFRNSDDMGSLATKMSRVLMVCQRARQRKVKQEWLLFPQIRLIRVYFTRCRSPVSMTTLRPVRPDSNASVSCLHVDRDRIQPAVA